MSNDDPIAFFLTWVTYGTWLPGDDRGWVEYHRGWQLPSSNREAECEARMSENAVRLTPEQRSAVERQIQETCEYRGCRLHAVNCRSNHVHAVVTAKDTRPKKIRVDLKAYATRCLKSFDKTRENWWAERGSIQWVYNDDDLESAVTYVVEGPSLTLFEVAQYRKYWTICPRFAGYSRLSLRESSANAFHAFRTPNATFAERKATILRNCATSKLTLRVTILPKHHVGSKNHGLSKAERHAG